jgi:metal-dependent amidase/aminoacylase/carboxypeptidase family protein
MRTMAITGLVVDIQGTGGSDIRSYSNVMAVALRADMDALPIEENTPKIPHRSKVKAAHMCGHDGHIATLLATA